MLNILMNFAFLRGRGVFMIIHKIINYLPENELLFCFNFLFKRSLSVLDYNFFHCGYLNRFKTIRITIFRHYRNVLPLYTLKQNLRYKYIYIIILVYTDAHYQAESTFDSDR